MLHSLMSVVRCLRTTVTAAVVLSTVSGGLFVLTSVRADEKKPTTNPAAQSKADRKTETTDKAKAQALGQKNEGNAKKTNVDKDGWMPLFNGKNLDGWKISEFGGQGDVVVEDGEIVILQGVDLSGIAIDKKDIPKINYEIQYEAQRAQGSDFFAGLTFPVNDSHCSLILGGWGGGVCGLSSLDGMDAVENQTTSYRDFEKGKWYRIRLEVTEDHIRAWIDDDQIVDVETKDHRISIRFEVERSKPLGFATWQTTGRIRNARMRTLPAPKAADAATSDK